MGKQRPEEPFIAKRQKDGGALFTKEADKSSISNLSLKRKLVKVLRKTLRFVYYSQCEINKSLEIFCSRLKIAIFNPNTPEIYKDKVKKNKAQTLKNQSDGATCAGRQSNWGLAFTSAIRDVAGKLEALKKGVASGDFKNLVIFKSKAALGQVFAGGKATKAWMSALYAWLKRVWLALLSSLTREKLTGYIAFLESMAKNAIPQSKKAFQYIKALPEHIRAAQAQMPFSERLKLAFINFRSFSKKHYHYVAPASAALLLAICLITINSFQFAVKATEGDKTIGVFSSRQVVDNAIADIETEVKDLTGEVYKLPSDLTYSIVLVPKSKETDDDIVRDRLLSTAQDVKEMYALFIDGKIIGTAENSSDITAVLDERLKAYRGDNVISIGFTNQVSVVKGIYPECFRVTKDELIKRLNKNSKAATTYTVKKDDVMINIARNFGMKLSELQALNPGIVPEKLQEGAVINISKEKPLLSVQVTKKLQYTEEIAFKTVETKDSTLAKNTKKVKVKGQEGIAQVLAEVSYLDGTEVSRNVLSRQVLKEPVTQQTLVGTKVEASSGSGKFTGRMRRPYYGYISSRYGYRGREFHTGVDLAGPIGSPIVAADGGTVSFVGYSGGYGRCIIINHGNGLQTLYGHCSKLLVKKGQKVSKGELIAKVGSTGRSTGPHCHFEVRINGKAVNPLRYIS